MNSSNLNRRAFVLRIAPGRKDRVPQALDESDLIIGWAEAKGLLNEKLDWKAFRKIVHDKYYTKESDERRAGKATGYLWLFAREMKPGDLVVVPHGPGFYVGEVKGPVRYEESRVKDDTAYRRSVDWLNSKKPILRKYARAALQSRMKFQGTCVDATDVLDEINMSLNAITTFEEDLHALLVKHTVEEIRRGKMDGGRFEQFIQSLLEGLGAKPVRIIPHSQDKGADIVAHFRIAGAFHFVIAVQAKHFKPQPPVLKQVVLDLLRGMEAESADLGMIITSGTISAEAYDLVQEIYNENGIKIELIDGEQLGSLILDYGLARNLSLKV